MNSRASKKTGLIASKFYKSRNLVVDITDAVG